LPGVRAFAAIAILAGCVSEEPTTFVDVHGLPDCASAKLETIFTTTRSLIPKGSVTDENYVTSRSVADPKLLLDGPQIFPAFRELIASAKHDVNLQTYVWEPDSDPARDILGGLADLARRRAANGATEPVRVRFLFDVSTIGFGSQVVTLPQTWAQVEALKLDARYVRFELAGVQRSGMGALHKKTVVVDGREAIITGANPQAHHDYDMPWRDAGYRFTGEVVLALQDDFDATWTKGQLWTCGAAEDRELAACSALTEPIERAAEPIALATDACLPMLVTTRVADTNPFSNRIDNPQDQTFLAAFGAATKHIRIQTPNLNDDAAKGAIVEAVQRGVRVDVVLAKGFNDSTEDYPGQGGTNEDNVVMLYDTLKAAGVSDVCNKLRIRWHARAGVAIVGNGPYASHAKYASLDDEIVIVGTANQDTQSWNNSREVNVLVDDPATTRAWDAGMFLNEFAGGVVVDACK
jgi:phosphatidylserine/phosphatidylglycerophosphate/cardiolipin synthase-like enzyme